MTPELQTGAAICGPPKFNLGRWQWALVGLIIAAQLVLGGLVCRQMTPGGDERTYYLYGWRILSEGSFARDHERTFNSKLPATVIYALPQYLGEKVGLWPFTLISESVGPVNPRQPQYAYHFWARLFGLLPIIGFNLVFFLWARRLNGPAVGLILLLWLALEPNNLAMWTYIVTDGWTVAVFFGSVYACRRYVAQPSSGRLITAGAILGLSLLVKNSAVLLAPIVIIAWFLEKWPATWSDWRAGNYRLLAGRGLRAGGVLVAWLAIALIVLNTGFGWQGIGASVADIGPESAALRHLPGPIQRLPLPLPYEFLNSVDQVVFDDQNSMTGGRNLLLGRSDHMGWAGYYLVALALKLPLPLILLVLWSIWLRWQRRRTEDDVWLMVPVAVLLLNLSFGTTTHIGVKYILPILPFLLIFAGRAMWAGGGVWPRGQSLAIYLGTFWLALSSLNAYPHYMSYFNELVPPRIAYQYLSHYNLDVGQVRNQADEWVKTQNKPIQHDDPHWKKGDILVRGELLQGLHMGDFWRTLRESYRPERAVAGPNYLFRNADPTPRVWRAAEGGGR